MIRKKPDLPNEGTVLITEDEAIIRVATEMMLKSNEYHVLSASSGEAGVILFVKFHKDISMVLLDMVLPELNGPDIYRQLKEIDPNVEVIATSGLVEKDVGIADVTAFIKKPYRQKQLIKIMHDIIAS